MGKLLELCMDILGLCLLIPILFFLGFCEMIDDLMTRRKIKRSD